MSLLDLTKICQKLSGNKIKIGKIKKTSNYDMPVFINNNNKVTKKYGWRVERNIYDICKDVFSWIINNKKIIKKYF